VIERNLNGQVVAITGGARGIGLATAHACAEAGMRVAVGDLDVDLARAAAADVPGESAGFCLDVADPESFARFLTDVEMFFGRLDVLVNNAGVFCCGPFAAEAPSTTAGIFAVNVAGLIEGSRLALQRFLPRRSGHLVNIASFAGLMAIPNGATYSATKHAVVGFTRALRQEVYGTGIRVMLVCPGLVDTDMSAPFRRPAAGRVLPPNAVGDKIVRALRYGRDEVVVPVELNTVLRVAALLPPSAADAVRRAAGVHRIFR
jgi:NAD(P)-dependent dehydrogenase (short-subunit alcohol dehydrogenase family)